MSENIKVAIKSRQESSEEGMAEINLCFSLPLQKMNLISEMFSSVGTENSKELAGTIIRMIAEEESECLREASVSDLEEATTFVLGEFGIPAHTKGYRYLREAIVLVAQRPLLVDGITKILYPAIAEIHGTTSARVERVVRHAIESGCTKGDTQALYHYFPHSISKDKLKPTNAEFIAVLGDVVKKRVSKRQLIFADI